MSIENEYEDRCPGCPRACPQEAPGCPRGEAWAASLSGDVPPPPHHGPEGEFPPFPPHHREDAPPPPPPVSYTHLTLPTT